MATKCPKCQFENPDDTIYCGKCASPLKPPDEISISPTKTLKTPISRLEKGSLFAERYIILEELGKGGMGEVFKVMDQKLNEEMALKLLKPEIAADRDTIERFKNELKLARKIAHRNVCKMHDFHEEKDTPFITMEYVEGEDLKSFIRKKEKATKEETIAIAKEVGEGLVEAHRIGVVHRDLKPQNVMINKESDVKIMDFGIARSIEAPGVTATGVIIGTPDYISPEQAEGEGTDERSDIYSLGVILYEMTTGQLPFQGDTAFSIALKHKSQLPQDPRKLNPDISDDLSRLILICMEKDKERRYQTAQDLLADLINIEEGLPLGTKIRPKRKTFIASIVRKKFFIPTLIVTLAIIALAIWQLLPQKEASPLASPGKPSVAVVYFENNTGAEDLGYLRSGLSELITTDLSQSKFLRVLRSDETLGILKKLNLLDAEKYSAEDLTRIAKEARVNHILRGSYIKAGDNFVITANLIKVDDGETIEPLKVTVEGIEHIFAKVDELTTGIKSNLELSDEQIASDIDRKVGEITTSSPEAYKYYVEGRNYFNEGDYRKSIRFMDKAIEIDPEFAMAYRSNWAANSNLGIYDEARKFAQKAIEHIDRVSDRESFILQDISERSLDKRIKILNQLLELYPDDSIGNNRLGLYFGFLEEWDKAIERTEVVRRNFPERRIPYVNLAWHYSKKGLYEKAEELLKYYQNNVSDSARIRWRLARIYLYQNKFDIALSELDKTLSLDPSSHDATRWKGDTYLFIGDFINAKTTYLKLLDEENDFVQFLGSDRLGCLYLTRGNLQQAKDQWQKEADLEKEKGLKPYLRTFYKLSYLYLKTGKLKAAMEECESGWKSVELDLYGFYRRNFLYIKGLIQIEMKAIDKALETADELKETIEKGLNRKASRYYYALKGTIELEKENHSKAIEYLEKASSLLSYQYSNGSDLYLDLHALFFEPLALAYYKSGDLEKALEEYERITKLTTGRLYQGDIYAKSFYMLGKIYEQRGDTVKAIKHYEKFLDLWKDADSGITEVEDARKRLARIVDFSY
jgi:serine/threonine protein kinase/Tfp pilus assembly protein PilF